MDHLANLRRAPLTVKVGAAVVIVLVALGCTILVSSLGRVDTTSAVPPPSPKATAGAITGDVIFVHILGEVSRPGLYELTEGDRAIDAVASAGGFLDSADQAQLNLARFVTDGEQIVVTAIGEVQDAPPGAVVPGKVNLNTADLSTLETLPRVGPAMAARIVAWRETNGRFTAIEDLLAVTGIGDKTFESLRELVTV